MKKNISKKKAFTIIEVLMAVLVFAIFSAIALDNFISFFNNHTEQKKLDDLQYVATQGMGYLEKQVRMGRNFVFVSSHELQFIDQNNVNNTIKVVNNQLVHNVGAATVRVIYGSQYFNDVTFQLDSPLITTEITLRAMVKDKVLLKQFKTTVFKRMEDPFATPTP